MKLTFSGRALVVRLNHLAHLLISNNATSSQQPATLALARITLERLVPLIKSTWDTNTYLSVMGMLMDPPIGAGRASTGSSGLGSASGKKGEDEAMDGSDYASATTFSGQSSSRTQPPSSPTARKGSMAGAAGTNGSSSKDLIEAKGQIDIDWVEDTREAERMELAKLDTELKGYSSNLIRESMRVSIIFSTWSDTIKRRLVQILQLHLVQGNES